MAYSLDAVRTRLFDCLFSRWDGMGWWLRRGYELPFGAATTQNAGAICNYLSSSPATVRRQCEIRGTQYAAHCHNLKPYRRLAKMYEWHMMSVRRRNGGLQHLIAQPPPHHVVLAGDWKQSISLPVCEVEGSEDFMRQYGKR